MKATINGKRYDSKKCEELASQQIYNNGNWVGERTIVRASDGKILCWQESNDIMIANDFAPWDSDARPIDDFDLSDAQEARCAELGLIEIV